MQTHATPPLELYVTVFTKTVESEDELSMIVGGEQQKTVESEPGFNGFCERSDLNTRGVAALKKPFTFSQFVFS